MLNAWLAAAVGTPLSGFAARSGRDRAAVEAALGATWSTGSVEGQVDLPGSRVLHAAWKRPPRLSRGDPVMDVNTSFLPSRGGSRIVTVTKPHLCRY